MKVFINGEAQELQLNNIAEVVTHFKLNESLVVTEVDGVIVDVNERPTTKLREGIKIEIVQFVGGG